MYKKIMQQTVEHHYDNIADAQQHQLETSIYSNISPENSNNGIALRLHARDLYTCLLDDVRDYIQSKINGTGDLTNNLSQLTTVRSGVMSSFFGQWFPAASVASLVNGEGEIITALVGIINNIAEGKDATPHIEHARTAVSALGQIMNGIAPNIWTEGGIVSIWNAYIDAVIAQVTARVNKEWAADNIAVSNGYDTLVRGQNTGVTGFSDVIGKGIIQAQPWRNWM